jgi:Ca-activated chloride channel family protein
LAVPAVFRVQSHLVANVAFEHPSLLLLIVLPFLVIAWEWRKLSNRFSFLIKAASVAALVTALSGPTMVMTHHQPMGVAVLVDMSTSTAPLAFGYAAGIATRMQARNELGWIRVIPFAEETGNPASGVGEPHHGGPNNIERALRDAAAVVPDGYSPRVVLISDGNAAKGDLTRAISELRQMQVPVDTIPLTIEPVRQLALQSVDLSDSAYAGEPFTVDVAVTSPHEAIARVKMDLGSGRWTDQTIHLQRGWNLIHTQQRTLATGAVLFSGKVSAGDLGEVSFERLLQLSRARVGYFSKGSFGVLGVLLRALHTNGAEIVQVTSLTPDNLAGIQLIILSNEDLPPLTAERKDQLAQYVRAGGGLLLLGGEEFPDQEDHRMDGLERALPATLAPPENAGDKCVVILMDKSSSMEGSKLKMAQKSVSAIADSLNSEDAVGVLAFDHTYRWVMPIQKVRNRRIFLQEVSNLTADGGTEIPPALSAAYHAALTSKAKYRHLVLVTDGISEEGESVSLAREASRQGIAISTVGLGSAINRSFLEAVARASGGRSYFLASPVDLKRITLKDVRDYTGTNSVERTSRPIVRQTREILNGVDMQKAPFLTRYTRYTTKPGAEEILGIGEAGKDPFYVRWQYGLGRVGLFTSEIDDWAGSWKGPAGFDRLWLNLTRDLFSRTKTAAVVASAAPGNEGLLVNYSLGPKAASSPAQADALVLGPNGFERSAPLRQTTPFSYTARVSLDGQSGVFRVLPVPASAEFPPTALLVHGAAIREPAADRNALREIAALTGGTFYTDLSAESAWTAKPVQHRTAMWPALVSLAIALNIVELVLRRKRNRVRRLI